MFEVIPNLFILFLILAMHLIQCQFNNSWKILLKIPIDIVILSFSGSYGTLKLIFINRLIK